MPFTRSRLKLPELTGKDQFDLDHLRRALLKRDLDLENVGALSIIRPEIWTPTLTFATPGDLNVVYSTRVADLRVTDWDVQGSFRIVTSTFTHTTAAGNLQITGLQYTPSADAGFVWESPCGFSGVTFVGAYTQMTIAFAPASATIVFAKNGSGVARANVTTADMPTGGSVILSGSFSFRR